MTNRDKKLQGAADGRARDGEPRELLEGNISEELEERIAYLEAEFTQFRDEMYYRLKQCERGVD